MIDFISNILYKIISLLDRIDYKKQQNQVLYNVEFPCKLEIKTDTGYKPISNLIYKIPFENWKIKLENGYELECADEHIVFDQNLNEVFVKDLNVGDYILTDNGPFEVIYIENTHTKLCMGDLTVNDENHRFYSNGILSHNSVTTGIFVLWKTLFNVDNNALILSKSGPAGRDLVKKIKDMYLYLPYHLKCGVMKWNQSEVAFDNGSTFHTEAFGPTAGVGSTINTLVLDEFAWCPPNDVDLFYENVIPTVTTMPNSNVCIISTQNGFNKFYQIWNGAITDKNIYKPYKVDWYDVPNFDPETKTWVPRTNEWKDMMVGVLGSEEAFYYQYGTQFMTSDRCLIPREKMAEIRDNVKLFKERGTELDYLVMLNPQYLKWDPDFNLTQLKKGRFVITVDLAEGGGNDYTVFHIFQVIGKDEFKEVGYYYTNQVPLENAALDFWLMCPQLFTQDKYIISIEWNTYGALFYNYLSSLNESEYRPEFNMRFNHVAEFDTTHIVHYKKSNTDEIDVNGMKSHRDKIPGIKLTHSNKASSCMFLKMMIVKDELIIRDVVTGSELENFEDKNGNGSYAAATGHDDLVMSMIQFPLLKNTPRYKDFMEETVAEMMWDNNETPNQNVDMYALPQAPSIFNDLGSLGIPGQFT